MRNRIIHGCFLGTFSFVSWRTLIVHRCVTFPVSGERDLWINSRNILHFLIAELAERSPIIIQNSSNPSSRKNLDVRPYDCTTVRGATFNMRGQLYRGHANATALSSSPVVSALGSESDDPGSSPSRGKALCPWDVREKNASSTFRLG